MMFMRLRFAPSPTGLLHIGNVRAAWFNYLLAKANNGQFILRVEDTDMSRSEERYTKDLMTQLNWLGITWDEGPRLEASGDIVSDGPHAPYLQSQRFDIYSRYAQQLLDKGLAYYCFMTDEEIESERAVSVALHKPYVYSGKYRDFDPVEALQKVAAGEPWVMRFKLPAKPYLVEDLVKGDVQFDGNLIGDFIIIKGDKSPTYNFAAAIDDHLMGITHVLRGEDHLANTPRQMAIFEAIGAHAPQYGHLPIILGTDGSKLSKRHGATSVAQFQELGYTQEALGNYLALLGWTPGNGSTQELFTTEELVQHFTVERIQKSGATFDMAKLNWLNEQHIRLLGAQTVAKRALENGFFSFLDPVYLPKIETLTALVLDSLVTYFDLATELSAFGIAQPEPTPEALEKLAVDSAPLVLEKFKAYLQSQDQQLDPAEIKNQFKQIGTDLGVKLNQVLPPIRVKLTGKTGGVDLAQTIALLNKQTVLDRLI
jgi:nondiscriminating glutamyl-tRNA synthetase